MPDHRATTVSIAPARSLAKLGEVKLSRAAEHVLAQARDSAGGSVVWRRRKLAELRDLLALAEVSGRLQIVWVDVGTDLRALVDLAAPVPTRGPQPDAPLEIGPVARLGLMYREDVLVAPQPGSSFVQILLPRGVWLPCVSPDENQAVCLGNLPIAVGIKEIVLSVYGALTLQSIEFSRWASGGLMNPASAEWWQANTDQIPLTRQPFLCNPHSTP